MHKHEYSCVGKKHLRYSTQATTHPLAFILGFGQYNNIVALLLPPLCFLYHIAPLKTPYQPLTILARCSVK